MLNDTPRQRRAVIRAELRAETDHMFYLSALARAPKHPKAPNGYITRAEAHATYGGGIASKPFFEALKTLGVNELVYFNRTKQRCFAYKPEEVEASAKTLVESLAPVPSTRFFTSPYLKGRVAYTPSV